MSQLLLITLGLLIVYLGSCAIWPYTHCPVCNNGKHARTDGQVWRKCWRCQGRSRRRRLGAVLLGRG